MYLSVSARTNRQICSSCAKESRCSGDDSGQKCHHHMHAQMDKSVTITFMLRWTRVSPSRARSDGQECHHHMHAQMEKSVTITCSNGQECHHHRLRWTRVLPSYAQICQAYKNCTIIFRGRVNSSCSVYRTVSTCCKKDERLHHTKIL